MQETDCPSSTLSGHRSDKDSLKLGRRFDIDAAHRLEHHEAAWRKPSARDKRGECLPAQALPIWRIGEDEIERRLRRGPAEARRIALSDLAAADEPERVGVAAAERPRLGILFDELTEPRAAREHLETHDASPREEVGGARALHPKARDALGENG